MKICCMRDTSFYYKQFDGIWSSKIVFRWVLHFFKYSKCVKRSIVYDMLFHVIKNFCKLAKWIQNGTMFFNNIGICWEDLIICLLRFTEPRWTDPDMTSDTDKASVRPSLLLTCLLTFNFKLLFNKFHDKCATVGRLKKIAGSYKWSVCILPNR